MCEQTLRAKGPVVSLFFSRSPGARVALEVGRHSPWISRLLEGLGLEAIVANARKARLIGRNERKKDRMDAAPPHQPWQNGQPYQPSRGLPEAA